MVLNPLDAEIYNIYTGEKAEPVICVAYCSVIPTSSVVGCRSVLQIPTVGIGFRLLLI